MIERPFSTALTLSLVAELVVALSISVVVVILITASL